MPMKVILKQNEKEFVFEIKLHLSTKPEELKMETMEFYVKYTGKIPQGDHYEMEIVQLPKEAEGVKLHIHPVPEKGNFVCFTHQIPDEEKVELFFSVWALGSLYTILTKDPFENYLHKCKNNSEEFAAALKNEFGIEIVSIQK
ncbi:TPA: hypothetical protein DEP21_06325 [Patescibacteria group bacterium]|nr:hypothetical protein [Candidatus Gracilibacteria bacterium]